MSEQAMRMALEALEAIDRGDDDRDFLFSDECGKVFDAITALRTELDAPQQPVARVVPLDATVRLEWASVEAAHNAKPGLLYTTPQAAPATALDAGGWRPIETAPRGSGIDGPESTTHPDYVAPPRLLLFTDEGIVTGYYDWYYHAGYGRGADVNESPWRTNDGSRTYGASHWMPLPAAPKE